MSSLTRIYMPAETLCGGTAEITGDDARHLTKVMRIRSGDKILICDNTKGEYTATVTEVTNGSVHVVLGEYSLMDTEPRCPITVYQCLTKGDKMDSIVQKAVELGATEIIPVMSLRCVSRPDERSFANKLERLRRIAEAASSQCGRMRIPIIGEPVTYSQACRQMNEGLRFICYEGEGTIHITQLAKKCEYSRISFLVGPEGGIDDAEAEEAKECGIPLVGLGKRILRTETASGFVLAALDVLLY